MKINRFEDIKAWQKARILTNMIYQVARDNKPLWNDYKFREQITAAAVSIMSNIAEGFSRHSKKEFIQFLFVAKGSCAEAQSQLYVALDQGYISDAKFKELYSKTDEVAKILSGFMTYLLNELNKLK